VWAVGEDIGRGGVFQQYAGLQAEFGPERVVDTPISEAAILGGAVGAAMMGTRPVVEMRFSDFALCAMDELINQAAKARYMFGGQARVPIVVREPIGMWRSSAAQHSQSLEAWYVHTPGLVVVCPSSAGDARGLLKASIRCDDPVVLMEHKDLWQTEDEVDLEIDGEIELGQAAVRREGSDVTIVSWSAHVRTCLTAADQLAESGIEAEVIDLRTLWPWDKEAVATSLRRTGRLLVTHESVAVAGFGAEVAAWMAEREFTSLRAPVARLGAPRIPVGYAPTLENEARVLPEAITSRVQQLVKT
jgi:pyruvate dehydrogenase E1 component beta subunit